MLAMIDAILFLHSDFDTSLQRRLSRSVRSEHESEGLRRYFKKHVWPGYQKHTVPALQAVREAGRPLLVEIDGTQRLEAVWAAAIAALPVLLGHRVGTLRRNSGAEIAYSWIFVAALAAVAVIAAFGFSGVRAHQRLRT